MPRRKIFISYHHKNDQDVCDQISHFFHDQLDLLIDQSLDEPIDSKNSQYIERKIREDYIQGSSVTVVLCGSETWKRKHVDWEINSTLLKQHGLLGLILQTARTPRGGYVSPPRLNDNVSSGYANLMGFDYNFFTNPQRFIGEIEKAFQLSRYTTNIRNWRPKMDRNL